MSSPPAFTTHTVDVENERLATVFDVMRQEFYCIKTNISTEEDQYGFSTQYVHIYQNIAAIIYVLFMYIRITDPLEDLQTLDEYKTEFDYDTFDKHFSCLGINLDDVIESFDLTGIIANSGTDTSALISNITRNTDPVCGCLPEQNDGATTGVVSTGPIP